MPQCDVVVVGNVGIDTNIYLAGQEINFDVEANFTDNLDYVGQAGGYASRGFAQLGYRTAFIGYVGDDYSGRFIRETFEKDAVDLRGLFVDPAGSSRSVNFMYPDGRRKNFYDGKSHMKLKPDLDICRRVLNGTKLVHFNIPNWARELLPLAAQAGVVISCDLQDMTDVDDPYRADFIKYADVLFFSNVNFDSPNQVMEPLLQKYPQKIIIAGMGGKGCALGTKDKIEYFEPLEFGPPVIDTNGAGDGLAVGFLAAHFLEDLSLTESIYKGQIAARHTCSQKANTSNLIRREQLF